MSPKKKKLKENGVATAKPNKSVVIKKKPKKLVKTVIKGEPLERVPQVNISMVSQFVIIIFFTLLYLF